MPSRVTRGRASLIAASIDLGQHEGIVVDGTAEHRTVQSPGMGQRVVERLQSAVEDENCCSKVALQSMHDLVTQRWHLAVFLRAQPAEPGVARVNDEDAAPGVVQGADEVADQAVVFAPVDANAVLDSDRDGNGILHCADAGGDEMRLGHQAGAKGAMLDPF